MPRPIDKTGMAGVGALQPMAAGFAAGSDLAGTSRAGIARSCPISALLRAGSDRLRRVERGDQCRPRNLPIACRRFAG